MKFLRLPISLIPVVASISCNDMNTTLLDTKVTLSEVPIIVDCKLKRNKEIGMISFVLQDDWEADRGRIKIMDGRVAEISVILIDSNGTEYKTDKYGEALGKESGKVFNAYFSAISKQTRIVKVKITSSLDVECEKIYWHCYDPL